MVEEEEPEDVEEMLEEVKQKSVKELLVEIKDVSELMIDLAYSALLYNNKEIAEDVVELEEYVNKLKYEIEIMTMLAARTPEDAGQLTGILHAAFAAEDMSNAAKELVDPVIREVLLHPVLKKAIEEAEETVIKLKVYPDSKLDGKTLKSLKLYTKTGMRVIALKRGREWITNVDKETRIKAEDHLILIGPKESVPLLEKMRGKPK